MNKIKWILWFLAVLATLYFLVSMNEAKAEAWFTEVSESYTMEKGVTSGRATLAYGKELNDWFNVRMEGEIGNIWFERDSAVQVGAVVMLRAEPSIDRFTKIPGSRFYVEAGFGIGYTPGDGSLVRSGPCGLIDGGLGVIFPIGYKGVDFIIGGKYEHVSSLKPGDSGINMFGVKTGLRW